MTTPSDIDIRVTGRTGRITLQRPQALNALTYDMIQRIEAALDAWATDDQVAMLVLDAEGDKAFCAGGDIADLYATGTAGDFAFGRQFWRDEYRMNAKMFEFPKPVATFLQGFTMGGGVGIGCHGSHRVVGDSSRIAMPECGIGLIPDVGGSLILARAPGRLGEYLGTTGHRLDPGDAIHAGFADYYLPEAAWPALIAALEATGDWEAVDRAAQTPPVAALAAHTTEIDRHYGGETLRDILNSLDAADTDFATATLKALGRNSPLSMACAVELVHRVRQRPDIRFALDQEYRYTWRAMEHGDFLEGIRAAIVDKDRRPAWRHAAPGAVSAMDVSRMMLPLGGDALQWEDAP
ncbi:MAG: enoyl-CoA hydratase/isomerase family protein [Rhodobacter sp.]|nr:enoyl-CoA hydratase/isomerase family protein [Rhodobacter sp.]